MIVSELERISCSVWSTISTDGQIYLATVIAEDLNTDESKGGVLELFAWNLEVYGGLKERPLVVMNTPEKCSSLCWTNAVNSAPCGLLITGSTCGSLTLYNPIHQLTNPCTQDDLYQNSNLATVYKTPLYAHKGPVRSMDCNSFKSNLFASSSDEDQVIIWDIEKMEQPMSPGNQTHSFDSVHKLAWNPQVQHILGTTSRCRCSIWDLRKSDPVLHLTKEMCQFEPLLLAWSPQTSTRLCLADPSHPDAHVQLWDLRYPKHMLALLAKWSSVPSTVRGRVATVNALTWSLLYPTEHSNDISSFHDPNMVAVTTTISSIPFNASCNSNEQLTNFLSLWSVDGALKTPLNVKDGINELEPNLPLFMVRHDKTNKSNLPADFSSCGSVSWIPDHPNFLSVTHTDGWTGIYNLCTELSKEAGLREPIQRPTFIPGEKNIDVLSYIGIGSFDDEEAKNLESSKLQPSAENNFTKVPLWMKRPCGVQFAFGSRLVYFDLANKCAKSAPFSANDTNATIDDSSINRVVHINHIDISDSSEEFFSASIQCLGYAAFKSPFDLPAVCIKAGQLFNKPCEQPVASENFVSVWSLLEVRVNSTEGFDIRGNIVKLLDSANRVPEVCGNQLDSVDIEDQEKMPFTTLVRRLEQALIMANFPEVLHLCMNISWAQSWSKSSIIYRQLSPMAPFAAMLAQCVSDTDAITPVRTCLSSLALKLAVDNNEDEGMRSVMLLFTALLENDWSGVVANWQLTKWASLLLALVNHVWPTDFHMFQKYCETLVYRLLNEQSGPSRMEFMSRCAAASLCSIVSGDLCALIASCNSLLDSSITETRVSFRSILPVAVQCILLMRSLNGQRKTYESLKCNPLTMMLLLYKLAVRLTESQDSVGNPPVFVCVSHLCKWISQLIPSGTTNQLDEIVHRLWCGLSQEDQSTLPTDAYEVTNNNCPYKVHVSARFSHNCCSCKFGQSMSKKDSSTHILRDGNAHYIPSTIPGYSLATSLPYSQISACAQKCSQYTPSMPIPKPPLQFRNCIPTTGGSAKQFHSYNSTQYYWPSSTSIGQPVMHTCTTPQQAWNDPPLLIPTCPDSTKQAFMNCNRFYDPTAFQLKVNVSDAMKRTTKPGSAVTNPMQWGTPLFNNSLPPVGEPHPAIQPLIPNSVSNFPYFS